MLSRIELSKDVEERESLCSVGGNETGSASVENGMEDPQTIKNRTICSSDPTSGCVS